MIRRKILFGLLFSLVAASSWMGRPVAAQDVTAVEEDWTLIIDTPNSSRSAPQITCAISPLGNMNSYYATFLINQRTSPSSIGGGLQLQLWNGSGQGTSSTFANLSSLNNANERITWTQSMTITNKGVLTIQVLGGSSKTWGQFGGKTDLIVSTQTSFMNLNAYDPNVTVANSGIDYGSNRVSKLVLNKVRIYTGNQKSVEQAIDRVVWPRN